MSSQTHFRATPAAGSDTKPFSRASTLATLLILVVVLAVLLSAGAVQGGEDEGVAEKRYKFVNGKWFDGRGFTEQTFYSVDGVFTKTPPEEIDETVDLGGGFVVPPFGEAHNHNLITNEIAPYQIKGYLLQGIFYVKIANCIREYTEPFRHQLNHPKGLDVAFAHGGLTAPGGHPVKLYQEDLTKHAYKGTAKEWFANRAYFTVADKSELEEKWPLVLAQEPDFIKTYLFYSEEFEQRRDAPAYFGRRGLDPRLLREIVEKAHGSGLRVTTHIETAADFHNAVAAGVDEIGHLPGYQIPASRKTAEFQIAEEDAELAAQKHIVVVTTTLLTKWKMKKDPEGMARAQKNHVRNLRLLRKHGVDIALGSDTFSRTSRREAFNLHQLGVFDNVTLLALWADTTAKTIFPDRKIGRLAEGYEASFLVLGGNPIENFEEVKNIQMRFKQGNPITVTIG